MVCIKHLRMTDICSVNNTVFGTSADRFLHAGPLDFSLQELPFHNHPAMGISQVVSFQLLFHRVEGLF